MTNTTKPDVPDADAILLTLTAPGTDGKYPPDVPITAQRLIRRAAGAGLYVEADWRPYAQHGGLHHTLEVRVYTPGTPPDGHGLEIRAVWQYNGAVRVTTYSRDDSYVALSLCRHGSYDSPRWSTVQRALVTLVSERSGA